MIEINNVAVIVMPLFVFGNRYGLLSSIRITRNKSKSGNYVNPHVMNVFCYFGFEMSVEIYAEDHTTKKNILARLVVQKSL